MLMMFIMKQTNEAQKLANHVAIVVVFLACVVCPLEGRVCTRVRSETKMRTVRYPGECHQSFEANCGWFSFEKCVFNETVACLKTRNMTQTIYRIVEDCCPGYRRNKGGQCHRLPESELKNNTETVTNKTRPLPVTGETIPVSVTGETIPVSVTGETIPVSVTGETIPVSVTGETSSPQSNVSEPYLNDLVTVGLNGSHQGKGGNANDSEEKTEGGYPDTGVKDTVTYIPGDYHSVGSGDSDMSRGNDDDDDGFFLGLSHGAYAGIICGILFIACVALLTAVHYRKRRLQEEKKATVPADQDAAQRQQMIPMEKIDPPPPPPTVTT
ncbi:hypothetical protein ACOMHN_019366 [Nucella lapillus]